MKVVFDEKFFFDESGFDELVLYRLGLVGPRSDWRSH